MCFAYGRQSVTIMITETDACLISELRLAVSTVTLADKSRVVRVLLFWRPQVGFPSVGICLGTLVKLS